MTKLSLDYSSKITAAFDHFYLVATMLRHVSHSSHYFAIFVLFEAIFLLRPLGLR